MINPNWPLVLRRINVYPPAVHNVLPPASRERIANVEAAIGQMPHVLVEMLSFFNGAELFIRNGPLLTIFGVTVAPPLPRCMWAPDWCIDKLTPWWRSGGDGRQNEWAIGMLNYGNVVILDNDSQTKEWDTSLRAFGPRQCGLRDWIDDVFREGDAYLDG